MPVWGRTNQSRTSNKKKNFIFFIFLLLQCYFAHPAYYFNEGFMARLESF